ncbi:GMC oxidoreductase [Annulohypoxylon truncatum]|uniref:GMC oxidoreductase n=1 Tax=Annulohypoxylon truncatum TaxID=327061 RepID=UPI002008E85E|nr:GMC oxidoreductase [Annulohypoxylon truncatum]KAI1214745.1 GMC oxidoreductase [Annulohypoxylon truncatum]
MGLYTELPNHVEEVDVIIAGGGTAGCVLAGRLAEAGVSVLVVEGGPNNHDEPTIVQPLMFITHYLPINRFTTFHQSNREKQLGSRQLIEPVGGTLGGGSSVNMMVYSRVQRADFDAWNTAGWSTNEMLPYLNKIETYHGPGDQDLHGHQGPLHITSGTYNAPRCEEDFLAAAKRSGFPERHDLNDLDGMNGAQRAMRYISHDGKRQDTAHGYVHPLLQDGKHPNLHVLVESQVRRVLFDDNKKASGIEYKPKAENLPIRTVKARKLVVVSCGVLGTPPVLERSGIGNPQILKKAGIQTLVADVPGVGENFNDHNIKLYGYKSSLNPDETIDGVQAGRVSTDELMRTKAKILGWNAEDVHCKVRPSPSEIASLSPAFQEAWARDFADAPSKPVAMMASVAGFPGDPSKLAPIQYFGVSAFTVNTYSRGHVHATGPEPGDRLDFATGMLTDPRGLDLEMQKWLYKKQREVVRRMDVFRGELPLSHPPFSPASRAALAGADRPEGLEGPLPLGKQEVAYDAEDEAVLEKWLRENVDLSWHPLGSCKMAPRDEMGVVDPLLNVYGVEGLKVVDLSIVPGSVSANTMNTACAIGEKAADIILGELGVLEEK